MAILDRNFGIFSAATPITVTRSSGSFGTGTVLVVALMTNAVWNTPAGWTQRTSNVNNMGLYSYDKAGAGESSLVFTPTLAASGVWYSWELSAGSTYLQSSASEGGTLSAVTTATMTGSGERHLLAMVGGAGTASRSVTGFSDSFTNLAGGQAGGGDTPFSARADRNVSDVGSTGYNTTGTFNASSLITASMILSYINAAGDVAPPTQPDMPQATLINPTSVDLSWSASTDDVAVTGYEIQVVGP